MIEFYNPFKPDKPKIPEASTVEGDLRAEEQAKDEARQRAKAAAAAGGGRQAALLTGRRGQDGLAGRLRSLLGA